MESHDWVVVVSVAASLLLVLICIRIIWAAKTEENMKHVLKLYDMQGEYRYSVTINPAFKLSKGGIMEISGILYEVTGAYEDVGKYDITEYTLKMTDVATDAMSQLSAGIEGLSI